MATTINRATRSQSRQPAQSPCCCPVCGGLECLDRTRYFAGQLLTEADLNHEQAYWIAKNRLQNRYLHGFGVVCGLQVVCGECDGWVTVKPGYAIDECGNDVIVCAEVAFNVIQAIQACCTPPKQTNCTPPRRVPPPTCQDAQQKWCITIQYKEQPGRPVAPLQRTSGRTSSAGCGCGGSGKGGCGCGGHGKQTANGTSCCCTSTPQQTAKAVNTACEPTRIFESFQLGVCPAPTATDLKTPKTPTPGTAGYQAFLCIQALQKLVLQAPNFAQQGITDPNTAFTLACNFVIAVRNYLAQASLTRCKIVDDIAGVQIIKPGQQNPNGYITAVQDQVNTIVKSLVRTALDCMCLALIPACPPAPCDNCLILACVTVQGGKVIDICHYGGGRQQVVTFPTLYYWLASFGLDNLINVLVSALERVCCGSPTEPGAVLTPAFAPAENLSSAGLSNPAMINRVLASVLSQNLGATIVNAGINANRTVDLRPMVGQSITMVSRQLEGLKIQTNRVEANAAWTDDLVAYGADFAPAAFPVGQPVTVFTKNELVVGFEPTSPTDSLKQQVAALQAQVDALQAQIGGSERPPRRR